MLRRHVLPFLILCLAACRFPEDTEGTLDQVEGGALRIGILGDMQALGDAERRQLEALAAALDAEPRFAAGSTHDLIAALDEGRIDILAGDIPEDSPMASRVAFSRPWGEIVLAGTATPAVFGIRKGEHAMLLAVDRALADRP